MCTSDIGSGCLLPDDNGYLWMFCLLNEDEKLISHLSELSNTETGSIHNA